MDTNFKIDLLRKEMASKNIDIYIIPTSDYHQSEYVGEYFKVKDFISGFTGSSGTLVVFKDESCLWTDGRYHTQAEDQLKGSEIKLFKQGNAGVPSFIDYILQNLKPGMKIGFDGKVLPANVALQIKSKDVTLEGDYDLVDKIWKDRPSISEEKIYIYSEDYSGENTLNKIQKIRDIIKSKGAYCNIISTLDDIAWIFNLRGKDVKNNPVFLSYAMITLDRTVLYIECSKLDDSVKSYLSKKTVEVRDYLDVFEDIQNIHDKKVICNLNKVSYNIYASLKDLDNIINEDNPSSYLKSIKNGVEIKNTREVHILDGVAITKFMIWLKSKYKDAKITEIDARDKIDSLRKEIPGFTEPSFDTISGFGSNGAIVHYKVNENSNLEIKDGVFLLDSGGQFLKGTTDITRTFILGKTSYEQRKHYTLVLKGFIQLSKAKFLYGTTGTNLDILARQFLWVNGLDFKHGTGHGVGHFLNVHEGPHGIRMQYNSQILEDGMIVTNEPGIYIEGSHGIRIENELLVRFVEETNFGKFLKFETLTFAPIDLDGVVVDLLSKDEIKWLNEYHKEVYEKISEFLNSEEKALLKNYTRTI